jgi:tetratricopeptide (TPR) repeat protein
MLRNLVYLTSILLVLSISVHAQNSKAIVEKGDRFFSRKDYENALASYSEAIKLNPDDPAINFRLGLCYLHTEKKGKSLAYLEKAYAAKPDIDLDIDYHLGLAYQASYNFSKAILHLENFKKKKNDLLTSLIIKFLNVGLVIPFHTIHPMLKLKTSARSSIQPSTTTLRS